MERLEEVLPFGRTHRVLEGHRFTLAGRGRAVSGHHGQPKGVSGDERCLAEESDALHQVRQLPDIARPGIGKERGASVGGEGLRP